MRGQAGRINRVGEDPILTAGLENLEQVFHLAKVYGTPECGARTPATHSCVPCWHSCQHFFEFMHERSACATEAPKSGPQLSHWMGMVAPDCVVTPPMEIVTGTSPLGAVDGMRTLN